MNSSATAGTSTSIFSNSSAQTLKENEFFNTGGDMRMIKMEQNVTVNRCCTAGNCASEVRENVKSGPIVITNVRDIIGTLLGSIFGQKAIEINPISSGNISQQSTPDHDARDHSEPRVNSTEITDMMAPASSSASDTSNSTVSSLTQSSPSERYIRSLLEFNQGYPLYEPELESHEEGVRVGDVGLITEDGGFDFLFNVCPPSDTNPNELPDDFEMLGSPEIQVKAHFQSDTHLFNKEVKRTEEPDIKYTCSGPEGVILELPLGATRFEARNKRSFKKLATRHAENWYRYTVLTKDMECSNGSLYIVTSCIKCTDWGIAVFDRPSNDQDYLRFITNEENQNERSKYKWKGSGAFIPKVSPNRGSAGSDEADGPNQCVFLRGYKIMLPGDIWDNITNSEFTGPSSERVSPDSPHSGNKSESPRQGDSSNSNHDDPSQSRADSGSGSDFGTTRATQNTCSRTDTSPRVILYEYYKASPAHPSDLINAMLLYQEPKAKVALTHDDDWCDLLQYHSQTLDSDPLAKVSLPYTSDVNEYGCASLKRSDLYPRPNVTVAESSSDTRVTKTSENRPSIGITTTIPTQKLPSAGGDLALAQQDHPHPFNATKLFAPHSQTSHYLISATVGSGVNRAFAHDDMGVGVGVKSLLPFDSFMGEPSADTTLQDRSIHIQNPVVSFKRYRCECGFKTKTTSAMNHHMESLRHSARKHACCDCGRSYTRRDSLARHMKICARIRANRLQIDDTQVSSHTATNTTPKLPNKGDGLAFIQKNFRQPFNTTTQSFTPHLQTSYDPISFITATAGSDVNRAFALGVDAGVTNLHPFRSLMLGGAEPPVATTLPDLRTDYMAIQEQDQPLSATTRSFTNHLQTSNHLFSTAATVEDDVNWTFAHEDMEVDTGASIQLPVDSSKCYRCECGHETRTIGDMERHRGSFRHSVRRFVCDCGKSYTRKDSLVRHKKICARKRANRLPIDETQLSSHAATKPTSKLPDKGDDLAFIQQDPQQPFNTTTQFSISHSRTSDQLISSDWHGYPGGIL